MTAFGRLLLPDLAGSARVTYADTSKRDLCRQPPAFAVLVFGMLCLSRILARRSD
ncbi:MAG: hypothetical protein QOC89_6121 [Paraburkholderia sp.]|jgi:hypothetical protein|nr:hypothetical protein [Paraburkholderia sp.]